MALFIYFLLSVERKLLKQRLEKRVPTTTLPLEPAQPAPSATNEGIWIERAMDKGRDEGAELSICTIDYLSIKTLCTYL